MKLRTLAPIGLLLVAATAHADTVVYDLDAQNAKEIANAIQATLNAQCGFEGASPKCRAELLSTGQLLVEAPAASQSQIAAVLKAITARNASPAPRVTLQYWVIYGEPGKPDAADASLKPLSAVLQQLERAHGELGFFVQDTVSITMQSGAAGSSHGGSLNVDQSLRASGENLDLFARLQFAPRPLLADLNVNLNVNVTIKRGEFVVLGERTAVEIGHDGPGKAELDVRQKPGMLFFVVHWPQGQ
ncbi:MAG TPA: hypothetical protein VMU03_16995 [Gammaproteobacteria bacterium]|nr:hypothetical protein [Gammaproteobacteria bacterium]